jgi:hypothetical protein
LAPLLADFNGENVTGIERGRAGGKERKREAEAEATPPITDDNDRETVRSFPLKTSFSLAQKPQNPTSFFQFSFFPPTKSLKGRASKSTLLM